jgi:hypothetical protein
MTYAGASLRPFLRVRAAQNLAHGLPDQSGEGLSVFCFEPGYWKPLAVETGASATQPGAEQDASASSARAAASSAFTLTFLVRAVNVLLAVLSS